MTNTKMQYKDKTLYISTLDVGDNLQLSIVTNDTGLVLLEFNVTETQLFDIIVRNFGDVEIIKDPQHNQIYEKEIRDYFLGKLKEFTIPLDLVGTEFQKQVWKALMEVPYGETVSYKDIAVRINNPKGMRAVGMANNKNKIPVIVPCHRIIGADGSLVGYGGGLHIKKRLLELEGIKIKDHKVLK